MLGEYLKPEESYFENSFYGHPKMAGISRESNLLISALQKCVIYGILENRSYDKAFSKLSYLPSVFLLFTNIVYFVIIEKGIYFILDAG